MLEQLGQFIPLHYHHHMLGDDARVLAFKAAFDNVVRAGARVLELGSGTGILSFFASQRASSVIAVEFNPAMVRASQAMLGRNRVTHKVTLVQADALNFLPSEPVDVVVCEMLHSALLREKQLEVLRGFKARYQARFKHLPRFVPEASILAVELLNQDYNYQGFDAPLPLFQDAALPASRSISLSGVAEYATIDYATDFPDAFDCALRLRITAPGQVNAVRFITKNLLAILPPSGSSIAWNNQHLVLPLTDPFRVEAGVTVDLRFSYAAGASIESLAGTLRCELYASTP
jgi:predicted RNA methylase